MTFSLLSVMRSESKNLAPMALSIRKTSEDSIKNENDSYLFKILLHLDCSRK